MTQYEIRDPVYGFITFDEWEKEIIDHPVFQRLRRIRQLGLTDLVYPGAVHTRFEHSLGVMHLATQMYDAILSNPYNKKVLREKLRYDEAGLKKDRRLLRLAALLHDVGHAPFSHASEQIMPKSPQTNKPYKHEDYTKAIIQGPLKEVIENHQINKTNYQIKAEEVAALIEGNVEILGDRIFWKVLISSQLDADRADYLLRDSHHIGVKYGVYDPSRLLNTVAIGIDPELGEVILGIDEDGWHVAESIVIARYYLFTQVYFHKTRRAYDYHLGEALKAILDKGKLPAPEQIENFINLDDFKMWDMLQQHKDDSNCAAILTRNHIRKVYSTPEIPSKHDEDKKEEVKNKLRDAGIWFYEDRASGLWYRTNGGEENKEIMIITGKSRQGRPLSEFSTIVKNIGEIKQIRVYVKSEQRRKAEEVLYDTR